MCGPLTSCCYCLPIRAGLYLTGVLLSFLEIAAMAHNIYLVTGNQKEYFLVTGNDSIDHFALALTGICLAYVSMLTINIVMMFGVYKHNR